MAERSFAGRLNLGDGLLAVLDDDRLLEVASWHLQGVGAIGNLMLNHQSKS